MMTSETCKIEHTTADGVTRVVRESVASYTKALDYVDDRVKRDGDRFGEWVWTTDARGYEVATRTTDPEQEYEEVWRITIN